MKGGWIAVWRDEEERYGIPEGTLLQWIDLKRRVSWRAEVLEGPHGQPVRVSAGQAVVSWRELSKLWGWSVNRCKRWVDVLKMKQLVDTVNKPAYTLISITCVDDIRLSDTDADTEANTDADTDADTDLHYREPINHKTTIPPLSPDFESLRLSSTQKGEVILPKNRRLSKSQKRRVRVEFNTPLMIRVGGLLKRKESTLWTIEEAEALEELGFMEDETLSELEAYYLAPKRENDRKDFRPLRGDIITILNNWAGEVDRAASWCREHRERAMVFRPASSNLVPIEDAMPEFVCL